MNITMTRKQHDEAMAHRFRGENFIQHLANQYKSCWKLEGVVYLNVSEEDYNQAKMMFNYKD